MLSVSQLSRRRRGSASLKTVE
uniref:Uncharacterized protein n=1 Tax=Anguilla anguilla TaxID=7936 RepID=A0A0E9UQU2_ANGAN